MRAAGDRVAKKRSTARRLQVLEKVELICAVLGDKEEGTNADEWVYVDDETDYEFRVHTLCYTSVFVVDEHERVLFHWTMATPYGDEEPIRAFRDEPHWLARLELLYAVALAAYRLNQITDERVITNAEGEAFNLPPTNVPDDAGFEE